MNWNNIEYRRKFYSDKKSQNAMTLEYMSLYGSITPIDALDAFGCFRLSARIADLREAGHNIVTTISDGEKKYAIYTLVED